MKPVILFDLDGTLLDSLSDIAQCGNRALALSGLPAHTQEEYRGYIDNGARKLVAYNTALAYPVGIVFAAALLGIFLYATRKQTAKA